MAWNRPAIRLRAMKRTASPSGKPPRRARAGSAHGVEARRSGCRRRACRARPSRRARSTPGGVGAGPPRSRSARPPSSSMKETEVERTVAAGEPVQNDLAAVDPPAGVACGWPCVRGRVRSCPRSLIAAAMTHAVARDARRASRRSSLALARCLAARPSASGAIRAAPARCMLAPIAIEASPRARRLAATMTSWTSARRPGPRGGSGTGAAR